MRIGLLVVDFYLDGCRSLKEKRRRLSKLRDRFGRQIHLAVRECGFQDDHQRARWCFVALASDSPSLDRLLNRVEDEVEGLVDARVVDTQREDLD